MSYHPLPKANLFLHKMGDNYEDDTHRPVSHHPSEYVENNLTEPPHIQPDSLRLPQLAEKNTSSAQPLRGHEQGWHVRVHSIMRKVWLTAFLPAVAFAYLAFCYVTATQLVSVRVWMINEPTEHLYGIKAGVTTLNIIIVTIALLPLKAIIDDIKAS